MSLEATTQALLSHHPELVSVGLAIEQASGGHPVTAACVTCGEKLRVDSVEAAGVLVIRCPTNHTVFRSRRE